MFASYSASRDIFFQIYFLHTQVYSFSNILYIQLHFLIRLVGRIVKVERCEITYFILRLSAGLNYFSKRSSIGLIARLLSFYRLADRCLWIRHNTMKEEVYDVSFVPFFPRRSS